MKILLSVFYLYNHFINDIVLFAAMHMRVFVFILYQQYYMSSVSSVRVLSILYRFIDFSDVMVF